MTRLLFLLITCTTLTTVVAQRTPLKVNGAVVNNPNFTNSPSVTYAVNGADVSATATLPEIAPAFTVLEDGATITLTASTNKAVQNATVTLEGNRTLAISGAVNGMTGVLIVNQDNVGSRTLALPASSKVIGGGAGVITLTTTTNAIDILTWVYNGTNYFWNKGLNYN